MRNPKENYWDLGWLVFRSERTHCLPIPINADLTPSILEGRSTNCSRGGLSAAQVPKR